MSGATSIGDAVVWFFTNDDVGRILSLILWVALTAVLLPSAWRCLCKRPRYMDAFFVAGLMLILNRIAFGFQTYIKSEALGDFCRWTSIFAGIVYLFVVVEYLRSDRV